MPKACPSCGVTNRDTARFCQNCSQPFMQSISCPACQALNPGTARFCLHCGTALTSSTPMPSHGTGMLSANISLGGRYLILQQIGKGGMGAVYKAADTHLGRKIVAVKELSESGLISLADKQQARQAFEQEAAMLGRLHHPNLPRVSDHFSDGGRQYLVMDFIDGKTLEDWLAATSGPFDVKQVMDWANQLCDVLDYLHSQQPPVVFRDLKPGNIMLDNHGAIKLIDFGIARLFKAGKASDTMSFGTAGYAPPEQYGKGQTDARSDIYALGATLHHLLTGRDPGSSPFTFPPVRSLNSRVPEAIERAIMKAVEQDTARRWQNARQMKQALTGPTPTPAPPPLPPPPRVVAPNPVMAPTYVAAPPRVSSPPVSSSAAKSPSPVSRQAFGFWGALFVGVILGGLAWYALDLGWINQIVGDDLARYLWFALFFLAGPLAFAISRRPLAAFIAAGVPEVLSGLFSILYLVPAIVQAAAFYLWGARPTSYGLMVIAPLAGFLSSVGVIYLTGGSFDTDLLVQGIVGTILAGTIAFIIGRIFKR